MREVRRSQEPSPVGVTAQQRDTLAQLVAKRNELVTRLESGSRQIEEMRASGQNVDEWERFWIRLLGQYEQVCDRLKEPEDRQHLAAAS